MHAGPASLYACCSLQCMLRRAGHTGPSLLGDHLSALLAGDGATVSTWLGPLCQEALEHRAALFGQHTVTPQRLFLALLSMAHQNNSALTHSEAAVKVSVFITRDNQRERDDKSNATDLALDPLLRYARCLCMLSVLRCALEATSGLGPG